MEILQMYTDVPAIELGADDYSTENMTPFTPSMESSQYWRSIDPGLNIRRPFDASPPDNSARLVHMEKRLLNLTNSAYGCGGYQPLDVSTENSPRLGLSTIWGSGSEGFRTMRYVSPNAPWGGSPSSTDSSPSDQAFSPDSTRHRACHVRDDFDWPISFEPSHPVSYSHSQYTYTSFGSHSGGHAVASAEVDRALACSMKEIQYNPDLEGEEILEDDDCIKIEPARPEKMAPLTPESYPRTTDASSQSEYDDSMKDEDEEKGVDSDMDPEYSPSRSQPIRRTSTSTKQSRSPTLGRGTVTVTKSTNGSNRVLKPSQNHFIPPKNKSKTVRRRRSGSKNGDSRPFICAFSHYGCESRFSSKNEWKRHVSSQHLQLGFYRCDTAHCNPDYTGPGSRFGNDSHRTYNDFNRKDLFTQHHRRMHTPWSPAAKPPSKKANEDFEEALEDVRQRCWTQRRQPPKKSQCIFCDRRFDGEAAWEERMEHIGKHFEKAERDKRDPGLGGEDAELRFWALAEGVIVDCGGAKGCLLVGLPGTQDAVKAPSGARSKRGKVMVGGGSGSGSGRDTDEDAVGDDE